MEQANEIKKILRGGEKQCKALLRQTLFTVAYYNALGYYPTSFFIWKNLIDIKNKKTKASLKNIVKILDELISTNKIIEHNGMHKLVKDQRLKAEYLDWYKEQIQKNKISTEKIKQAKKWAKASSWVPYLRGLFLTGTLAMKRGGTNSDWDVLVVLKKDRIWIGRLILTGWLHLIKKRRHKQIVQNRFCLNQFVVDKKLKFKEQNEFFGNELIMAIQLLDASDLKNKIFKKNKNWLKEFKPNIKFRKSINTKNGFSKKVQKKAENILEIFRLAEMINALSKKIMLQKIIDNPKTYSPGADIRYSDFFLVFLPQPQREKVKKATFEMLTKIDS